VAVKSITQSELERILFATKETQFISFVSVTDPDMRKRANPYFGTRKVSIVVGVINWTYSRTVNRQRGRESKPQTFRALRRRWGTRLHGTPLVKRSVETDEGEEDITLYLEVKIERRTFHYFNPKTRRRVKESSLAKWLKKAERNERQGVEREIVLRDYKLANIAELTIAGQQYRIAPAAEELLTYIPAPKPKSRGQSTTKPQRRRTPSTSGRSKRGAL
jgi:hypothetical protein